MGVFSDSAHNCWPGCANNECLRSHGSGDVDIELAPHGRRPENPQNLLRPLACDDSWLVRAGIRGVRILPHLRLLSFYRGLPCTLPGIFSIFAYLRQRLAA